MRFFFPGINIVICSCNVPKLNDTVIELPTEQKLLGY